MYGWKCGGCTASCPSLCHSESKFRFRLRYGDCTQVDHFESGHPHTVQSFDRCDVVAHQGNDLDFGETDISDFLQDPRVFVVIYLVQSYMPGTSRLPMLGSVCRRRPSSRESRTHFLLYPISTHPGDLLSDFGFELARVLLAVVVSYHLS